MALKPIIADNKLVAGVVWEKLKDQVKSGDQIMAMMMNLVKIWNFATGLMVDQIG